MVRHGGTYPLSFVPIARWTMQIEPSDTVWSLSDTGWAKTAYGRLFGQWALGAVVLQYQNSGRFDPHRALKVIEQCRVSVLCLPPTAYRMLISTANLDQPGAYDLSSLRHCISSGEPLNPKVISVWKQLTNLTIYDFYGQTETTVLASNFLNLPLKIGSMGLPFPGLDLVLVNDEFQEISEFHEEGQLAVRCFPFRPPGIFLDYWIEEDLTKSKFINGYYLTGDKAYRDSDGYLWFVGRADDIFKSSGYRIGPFEVESALMEHPAVVEAAVIGVPDETRGLAVKAFVVLKPGWQGSPELTIRLQEHVKSTTAPYKYPRIIEYVQSLPKTPSGKIKRGELRVSTYQKLSASSEESY